ncbi:AMP-binding protein [uncultured Rothia sp.]|uniref:AMP-binding protein n=1 Tax=uncultured Rothia sp. TaxID=316088 RepID=UPI0032165BD2
MTEDIFPLLASLPAPLSLGPHTVTVGHNIDSEIATILRGFEHSLARPSEDTALVVTTSGSTGIPKKTVLSSRALYASAKGTEQFVGVSRAQWMLALPPHYVAGAQVLARSVLAGTKPVITSSISNAEHFTAKSFLSAFEQMNAASLMLSLVPAQLHTLLEASETQRQILDALRCFDGILLGGAPAAASLLASARQRNIKVFTTYGSAETSGGCIYNGKPLPGVRVRLEEKDNAKTSSPARIWLGGQTIASGYLADEFRTQEHFFKDAGGNFWYRTDDVGTYLDGRLRVEGRSDDLIITGGVKVSPAPIVAQLEKHPEVREAFVCGVPDPKWGSAVVSAVNVRQRSGALLNELKELSAQLSPAQKPKHIEILKGFPLLTTGKPDRKKLALLLQRAYKAR